jgi:hypothetical protein
MEEDKENHYDKKTITRFVTLLFRSKPGTNTFYDIRNLTDFDKKRLPMLWSLLLVSHNWLVERNKLK